MHCADTEKYDTAPAEKKTKLMSESVSLLSDDKINADVATAERK